MGRIKRFIFYLDKSSMAKILIVEDDESQQFLFHEELVEEGYEVVPTKNGVEALKCLEESAFEKGIAGGAEAHGADVKAYPRVDSQASPGAQVCNGPAESYSTQIQTSHHDCCFSGCRLSLLYRDVHRKRS